MFRKMTAVVLLACGLTACADQSANKSSADDAAQQQAAAKSAPAPLTKCQTDLKSLDNDILTSYTKMSPTQFDRVSQLRDQLSAACSANAPDDKVNTLVAEAGKVLSAKPEAPKATKKKTTRKK